MSSTAEKALGRHLPTLMRMWHPKAPKLNFRELKDVSESLLSLQRGLTGSRKLSGAGYMEDNNYLGAYLLYYWPVSFLQIYYASQSNRQWFVNKAQSSSEINILDLGSGPGPASASLCDLLSKMNPKLKINLTMVDYSTKAVSLAAKIIKADFGNVTINPVTHNFEKKEYKPEQKFDIIVMSHALNEMWKSDKDFMARRLSFITNISQYLFDDGILFLSEPAMLESSRNLIALRNSLIDNGFEVYAPCTCSAVCPALKAGENQTCHAEIAWQPTEPAASIAKNAGLDRESVKMTYFILGKQKQDSSKSTEDNVYRVVSDGMLNKSGRVRYLLCNGTSRIPLSAKKDEEHAKKIGFFNLERYDRVTVNNPELRGDKDTKAYGVDNDTTLSVYKFTLK